MKYGNFFIDEEKGDSTNKQIFTVWEERGIYHLGTFYTIDEAKSFVDNGAAAKEVTKIAAMRRKYNR